MGYTKGLIRIVLTFIIFFLIVACAGTYFTWDTARQIKMGMTEAELQQLMGQPNRVTSQGDKQIWVWAFTDPTLSSRSVSVIMQDGEVIEVPKIPDSFK